MDKKQLTNTLCLQLGMLEDLLSILERETHELADINLDAMEILNQHKEDTTARIELHTASLRKAISEQATEHGLPPEASLGLVVTAMANKEISKLHLDINSVAQRVQEVATMNHEIAKRFAATASLSLDLLTRLINQSSIYGVSGGYQQRSTGAVMINREA